MTKSTLSLVSVAINLWSDLKAVGDRIEVDMRVLTQALCLSNDPSGLQTLFDSAYTDAKAADKTARSAITGRFNLLAKRAHYWAGQSGFVLSMPRLDGKGTILVPTVTPKETAKLEAQGAAAERKATADKALADMAQRNALRTADAVKALTPSDIALNVTALCSGADIHPLEVILTLSDSLRTADLESLATILAEVLAVRKYDSDARYNASRPAPALPDTTALPDVAPAPTKRSNRRQA